MKPSYKHACIIFNNSLYYIRRNKLISFLGKVDEMDAYFEYANMNFLLKKLLHNNIIEVFYINKHFSFKYKVLKINRNTLNFGFCVTDT